MSRVDWLELALAVLGAVASYFTGRRHGRSG
jgi:hypothetical protein